MATPIYSTDVISHNQDDPWWFWLLAIALIVIAKDADPEPPVTVPTTPAPATVKLIDNATGGSTTNGDTTTISLNPGQSITIVTSAATTGGKATVTKTITNNPTSAAINGQGSTDLPGGLSRGSADISMVASSVATESFNQAAVDVSLSDIR